MSTTPVVVRPISDAERAALEADVGAPDAVVLRRAHIVGTRARREPVSRIAPLVGFSGQAVGQVIHPFDQQGLAVLQRRSTRPHTVSYSFDRAAAHALRALLPQSPRLFGKDTSLWTREVAAEVADERGRTAWRVSDEAAAGPAFLRGGVSRYLYVHDGRGTIVGLVDTTGKLVDSYAYAPWGKVLSSSESVPQPFLYAGYWYDRELGWYNGNTFYGGGPEMCNALLTSQPLGCLSWYWLQARTYDPQIRQFLQPDPATAQRANSYTYAQDDPVDITDSNRS